MRGNTDTDSTNQSPMTEAPKLPWKFRAQLGLYSFISKICRRPNITVNRPLMRLVDPQISPSAISRHGVFTMDTVLDPTRNLWCRLFIPAPSTISISMPLIIYYHGGGFAFFSPKSMPYDNMCRRLARDLEAVVVSVNYRLAPEHRYPCQYEDGFDALKFLDDSNDLLPENSDFSRCFIAGDSAGGNLAHHVAVRAGDYNFKKLKIKGLVAIQPFFGGEERTESEIRLGTALALNIEKTDWHWKAFLPNGSDRNHPAANVFGNGNNAKDISGTNFPATLLILGGCDPLLDWGRRYYEWLKMAGKEVELIEYPNAIHGFYATPDLPETSLLNSDVRDFVQKQSTV